MAEVFHCSNGARLGEQAGGLPLTVGVQVWLLPKGLAGNACFMSLRPLYVTQELHKRVGTLTVLLCESNLLGLVITVGDTISPKELTANVVNFIALHFSLRQHKLYNKELYADFIAQIRVVIFSLHHPNLPVGFTDLCFKSGLHNLQGDIIYKE